MAKGHAKLPLPPWWLVDVLREVLAAAACHAAFRFFSPEGSSPSWRPALSTIWRPVMGETTRYTQDSASRHNDASDDCVRGDGDR